MHLHIAKTGSIFDETIQSWIVTSVLRLVAGIDRDFTSSRIKEALAKLLDVSPNTLYEWLKVRRPGSTPTP